MSTSIKLEGKDNFGRPRQEFANKIAALSDESFIDMAAKKIWLSAYANNNHRSDYHWQADAFYDEAKRRGKQELYKTAYDKAVKSA